MKRLFLTLILICVLSVPALAGQIPSGGIIPPPPDPEPTQTTGNTLDVVVIILSLLPV